MIDPRDWITPEALRDLPAPGPAICPSCGWSGEERTCPDCGRATEPNQDKGATYE